MSYFFGILIVGIVMILIISFIAGGLCYSLKLSNVPFTWAAFFALYTGIGIFVFVGSIISFHTGFDFDRLAQNPHLVGKVSWNDFLASYIIVLLPALWYYLMVDRPKR